MISCAWSFDKDKLNILLLASQPAIFKDRLFSHLVNKFYSIIYLSFTQSYKWYNLYDSTNSIIVYIKYSLALTGKEAVDILTKPTRTPGV